MRQRLTGSGSLSRIKIRHPPNQIFKLLVETRLIALPELKGLARVLLIKPAADHCKSLAPRALRVEVA